MKKAIYALLSITIYLYSPLLGRTPEQILGKFTLQNETPYDFDGFNVLVVNEAYKKNRPSAIATFNIKIPSKKAQIIAFPILSYWQKIAANSMKSYIKNFIPLLLAGYRGSPAGREAEKARALDRMYLELAAQAALQHQALPKLHLIEVHPIQCSQDGKNVKCKGMFTIKQDELIPHKFIISQE